MNIIDYINKMPFDSEELLNYLNNRIYNVEVCTKEELEFLDTFVNDISKFDLENKIKIEILSKISDLYLMSVNMTDYNIIKFKNFFYYNSSDVINYLKILLKDCPNIIDTNILCKLLYKYIGNFGDVNEILKVINEYKDSIDEDKFNEFTNYIGKSSLTIACKNILKELNNINIDVNLIFKYLELLSNINLGYCSQKRLLLIKEIIEKIYEKYNLGYFTRQEYDNIIDKIDCFCKKLDKDYEKNKKIKECIENGTIDIKRTQPYFDNIYYQNKYNYIDDEIISINKNAYNKNAAFSIKKDGNLYTLKVYITDVPTFLSNNRQVAISAYRRGENIYLKNGDKTLLIPMLPLFLIKKNLSLNTSYIKSAIEFTFVIDENGIIVSKNIDKKAFRLKNDLTVEDAKNIINGDKESPFKYCLRNYYDLCKIIKKSNNKLSDNLDELLITIPLRLVDNSIANEINLGIFRDNKRYTKEKTEILFSATPLSKYCCNINLTLFLEQNGIHICDEKDLCYVEDHIDDIIKHLNDREEIKEFVSNNYSFCKKYVI